MCSKKRDEPDPVLPVEIGSVRYEAPMEPEIDGTVHWGGAVAAYDIDSGDQLWVQAIYTISPDPDMEDDKQDVFVTALTKAEGGKALLVENEDGERFRLDLTSRAVTLVAG